MKFSSDRLKDSNYNIDITLDEAKKNAEVITINNSELVRTLFRYKNVNFDQNELDELLILKKKLKKSKNNDENRKKLKETIEKIEKILFLEDLVSLEFTNKTHYEEILKRHGFYINGIRFVPFMASAGMIRRNTALFINNNIKHPIMDILENERDESTPLVIAKWGAYFSLYSSTSLPVSFPRFAVIADKEIQTVRDICFVQYKGIDVDDDVKEIKKAIKCNAWDGQGLITPKLAAQWSEELELDYVFSSAVVRAPFIKGLVTVFDIERFANLIAKKYTFTDIYGNEQDIRNFDLIISESMFKLYNAYKNTDDFIEKCHHNKLGFSITKINPKADPSYSRTSYQFLQILDLNDADISTLCKPTVDWFRDMSGESAEKMLIYATGESKIGGDEFHKMDVTTKALAVNPSLSNDRYIYSRFKATLEKKKKESYMGNLFINANYQFMIADPYYQACHMFNLECEPLLKDGQHYSEYWLNKGITTVAAIRSPIVHHSEFNVLNLQNREDVKEWYKHIHDGIIYPANGIGMDCAIHGGADFDGDLVCTINSDIMIKGRQLGNPIIYESQKSEKTIVDSRDDSKQVESQLNGFNSKVGFATNISSSLYCMLEEFPDGSKEKEILYNRLKIGRVIQGEIIDGVKGLKVPPFREHWTKYKKITDEMPDDEKEKWTVNNSIVCLIRPAFFRFLYPHYMTRYHKEIRAHNIYSHINFGKKFDSIMQSEKRAEEEEEMIKKYKRKTYFLDNDSIMNKISREMRRRVPLINRYSSRKARYSDYSILKNKEVIMTDENLALMKEYLQEYKTFKTLFSLKESLPAGSLESFISLLQKKCFETISTNELELATYAIEVTYNGEKGMVEFPWNMFPEGILANIIANSTGPIKIPVKDKNGEIEYLWEKYTMKEIQAEALYEN